MYNMIGFVPSMYVSQVICDNREKREQSAKRNYQRMAYEFAENSKEEEFEVMLNDEIRKIRETDRYSG